VARNEDLKQIIYIFVNAHDQNVISHGISFQEFFQSLENPPSNLLLLNKDSELAEIHPDTQLAYLTQDKLDQFLKSALYKMEKFSWIDFEETYNLDTIEGRELAELLYLGHLNKHLELPFYKKLNNRFVYLTSMEGYFNKIYYRNPKDFYYMLGEVLSKRISEMKLERGLFNFKKRKPYPPINQTILKKLEPVLAEGVAFSFHSLKQSRAEVNIPFWIVGDYFDMEDMMEGFSDKSSSKPDGRIIFDKKLKDWSIQFAENKVTVNI